MSFPVTFNASQDSNSAFYCFVIAAVGAADALAKSRRCAFLHSSAELSPQLLSTTPHKRQHERPKSIKTQIPVLPTKMSHCRLFKDHFDDPTFSDITLKLSDRSFNIGRVVLCRRSEYFTKLLTGGFWVHNARPHTIELSTDQTQKRLTRKIFSSRKTTQRQCLH
jgi:hypothetical protein